MKRYTKPVASILLIGTFAWVATAMSQESPHSHEEAASQRMDSRKKSILKRIGMSAPLERPDPGQPDFVADAQETGWIIESTLEEVEAALHAAGSTPSNEDDIAAMRMAHRGSYRFFLDDGNVSEKSGSAVN